MQSQKNEKEQQRTNFLHIMDARKASTVSAHAMLSVKLADVKPSKCQDRGGKAFEVLSVNKIEPSMSKHSTTKIACSHFDVQWLLVFCQLPVRFQS